MSRWRPLEAQYADRATRDLRRLDRQVAIRIRAAILRYAGTGHGDVKRLQGSESYRLRVGNWRVRFEVVTGEIRIMLVVRVLHRSSAYE